MKFDAEQVIRMAADLDALLVEVGGPDEVRELSVQRFRLQLDEDDAGAERVLRKIKAAHDHHAAASALLGLFGQAVTDSNMALANGAFAGVQALVRGALAEEAPGEGEED